MKKNINISYSSLIVIFGIELFFEGFKLLTTWSSSVDENSFSGWGIVVILLFLFSSCLQISNGIISLINSKLKSFVLLIFMFFISLGSVVSIILSKNQFFFDTSNELFYWIYLIYNIAISILILFKIIFDKKIIEENKKVNMIGGRENV